MSLISGYVYNRVLREGYRERDMGRGYGRGKGRMARSEGHSKRTSNKGVSQIILI